MKNIINRQEFESFLEAVSGEINDPVLANTSTRRIEFNITEQLVCALQVNLLVKFGNSFYFENSSENYTHVRIAVDGSINFNMYGAGARKAENWELVEGLVASL